MQGYVSFFRKILDNPIITKDTEYFAIYSYLLLNATHTEIKSEFKNTEITLKPGQLITGRKKISEKFNISESKVQRVLKKLEIEQLIEQQTTSEKRLITVLSWDKYNTSEQRIEQQVNNKRTTSEQQVNTNNNVIMKKCKNVNKKDICKIDYSEFVSMKIEEYQKLVDEHGEVATKKMIEILDNYKGSSGKKYASDYKAMLTWVVSRYKEDEKKKPKTTSRDGWSFEEELAKSRQERSNLSD